MGRSGNATAQDCLRSADTSCNVLKSRTILALQGAVLSAASARLYGEPIVSYYCASWVMPWFFCASLAFFSATVFLAAIALSIQLFASAIWDSNSF
jgi:hypothetical protein